jgi:hypothetical protein
MKRNNERGADVRKRLSVIISLLSIILQTLSISCGTAGGTDLSNLPSTSYSSPIITSYIYTNSSLNSQSLIATNPASPQISITPTFDIKTLLPPNPTTIDNLTYLSFANYLPPGPIKPTITAKKQVIALADSQSIPDIFLALPTDYFTKLSLQADFSKYFIVIASWGMKTSGGYSMRVMNIWQIDHSIYVQADFIASTGYAQQVIGSVFSVVRVSKENMTVYGDLNIVLIDQEGSTQATNTFKLS